MKVFQNSVGLDVLFEEIADDEVSYRRLIGGIAGPLAGKDTGLLSNRLLDLSS